MTQLLEQIGVKYKLSAMKHGIWSLYHFSLNSIMAQEKEGQIALREQYNLHLQLVFNN